MTADILCIGSVLWDIIGRSPTAMRLGSDVPGRITRLPGGVAMNIAMTLRRFGLRPAILTAIGRDSEGDELIAACDRMGLLTAHVYRSDDLPTDRYMAVEGANGLIAAIADAHSLEDAGDQILEPIRDGRLAGPGAPWRGIAVIDGNLTTLLVGGILFAMGTGPVKGFAVTMSLGIITSMFTAIFVTRAMVNLIFGGRDFKKLWI